MTVDRLAAAIALTAASLVPLSADAAGRIEGRVGDAGDAINLEGAVVTLTELDRRVATGRDGGFSFAGVPAGTHTLRIEYLGADPVTTRVTVADGRVARTEVELGAARGEIENLIVYGQAAEAASALNRQRASDSITSIVSANAIGALPDQNAAEALSRVPGTFLERDQGEGRYVGIRGIDPDLNATSVNGLRIPAPEDDKRAIQLDIIPAELLSSLEVTKSVTPDMDGDAIGGSINIESVSAFDRRGRTFSLSAESTYTELTEDTNPRLSGSFSDVVDFAGIPDSLGVAVAASWYDREFGSDNVENGDGWPDDRERLDGSEFRAAEEIEQREYLIERERYGAALNLDFRPNDYSEYYLRSLYSVASDQEFRHANVLVLEDDQADNGGARNDSTVRAATWDNAILEKEVKDRYEEASVLSVSAGGNHFVDAWTLEYQIGFSEAEQDTPDDQEAIFVGEGVTLGYVSLGEEIGVFGANGVDDPATYQLDEASQSGSLTEDQEWSYRFDVERDMSDRGWPGSIRFGGKARLREKTADGREIVFDGFGGDFTIADGFAASVDYDLAAPFIGPAISPDAVDEFFADRSAFESDDEETLINGVADEYAVDENVYAAYGMTRLEFGDVRLVGGVRWERTDTEARGNTIVVDEATGSGLRIVDFEADTSYDEILPSLTLRWALNDTMLVRAAASRTIARPEIGDIAPLAEIELEDSDGAVELAAEIGNPDLDPYKVANLDAAFEWYFGDIGLFSVGVFYKDIEDFIVRANVADSIDLTRFVGNMALDDAEVIQPINGESASILGAEVAFTRKFSNLPAPFDGLLVNANATFSDSDAEIALRDSDIPLPGQSDMVWNMILGYEKGPMSMRLSSTFTGERLGELVEPDDPAFDRYQSDHFQVDFAATWDLNDAWQLQFEAVNINDEPFYANFGRNDRFNSQFEEYGRTFTLGVRFQNQ